MRVIGDRMQKLTETFVYTPRSGERLFAPHPQDVGGEPFRKRFVTLRRLPNNSFMIGHRSVVLSFAAAEPGAWWRDAATDMLKQMAAAGIVLAAWDDCGTISFIPHPQHARFVATFVRAAAAVRYEGKFDLPAFAPQAAAQGWRVWFSEDHSTEVASLSADDGMVNLPLAERIKPGVPSHHDPFHAIPFAEDAADWPLYAERGMSDAWVKACFEHNGAEYVVARHDEEHALVRKTSNAIDILTYDHDRRCAARVGVYTRADCPVCGRRAWRDEEEVYCVDEPHEPVEPEPAPTPAPSGSAALAALFN